ncbi:class C sortase [Xylanimonas ulmi]|uniref:Sortase A n=1 Tax=Xylanimonas ulmi TaxID=228973 RepID=A0A4Q7M404_9MICO|nr:class C sortase [Xylanibacterium ulmi]RZS62284.1 sortase A [Xylanibacterium ulmi]
MRLRFVSLVVIVAVGSGLILYPAAGDWLARRAQTAQTLAYAQAMTSLSSGEQTAMLTAAREYNRRLAAGRADVGDHPDAAYLALLRTASGDVVGQVSIPAIAVTLPIYPGTDDAAMSRGAGHLYGTSLPVGGPTTHAVLAAHSGLRSARMFDDLLQVEIGDRFTVTAAGQTLTYDVDRIDVVAPSDNSQYPIVHGEDYVTLLTCTPIGVNSHRLLVRGSRTDAPAVGAPHAAVVPTHLGFPWWAVTWAAAIAAAAAVGWLGLLRVVPPRGPRGPHHEGDRR